MKYMKTRRRRKNKDVDRNVRTLLKDVVTQELFFQRWKSLFKAFSNTAVIYLFHFLTDRMSVRTHCIDSNFSDRKKKSEFWSPKFWSRAQRSAFPESIIRYILTGCTLCTFYLSVNVFSTKVLIGDTIFYVSNWRRDRHFTWSSEPREGLACCSAKGVPSFLGYFKTLSIGPAPGIEPATSRSAVNTLYRLS